VKIKEPLVTQTPANRTASVATTALLIAIGIAIPMLSPFKIMLEPASFTLASHVAIFIAMFISPWTAAAVAVGTTAGFFLGGFPIVVVARAASHIVWALGGALVLKRYPGILGSIRKSILFAVGVGLVHGLAELAAVAPFYFGGLMPMGYGEGASGFLTFVVLFVGVGTVIHSLVDFGIAMAIWKPLQQVIRRR